eukprot:jgi/Galph1/2993/GphlegSOOS_G1695.1
MLFRVRVHTSAAYEDLLVNPDYFLVSCGDILQLSKPDNTCEKCYVKVMDTSTLLGTKAEISISQSIAERFQFLRHSWIDVVNMGNCIEPLHFVEVVVKNQYLSSSEMWRLKFLLNGKCIYSQQVLSLDRIQATVKSLFLENKQPVESGLVSHETNFNFRSQSAKIIWLVEFSKELWEETSDGRLYFELMLEFIERILKQWNEKNLTHLLTIIVFCRVFYKDHRMMAARKKRHEISDHTFLNVNIDTKNRHYSDLYFTLMDNERLMNHSKSVILRVMGSLRRLFYKLPLMIGWSSLIERLEYPQTDTPSLSAQMLPCDADVASSQESSWLPAFNLCLNHFEHHHIDRNLRATGNSLVLFTASRGMWKVEENLMKLTKRRLLSCGVGCEIVSVGVPISQRLAVFQLLDKKVPERRDNPNQWTTKTDQYFEYRKLKIRKLIASLFTLRKQPFHAPSLLRKWKEERRNGPLFIGSRYHDSQLVSQSHHPMSCEVVHFEMESLDMFHNKTKEQLSEEMDQYDRYCPSIEIEDYAVSFLKNTIPRSTSLDTVKRHNDLIPLLQADRLKQEKNGRSVFNVAFIGNDYDWFSVNSFSKQSILNEMTSHDVRNRKVNDHRHSNQTRWAHTMPFCREICASRYWNYPLEAIPSWIENTTTKKCWEVHEKDIQEELRQSLWSNLLEPSVLPLTSNYTPETNSFQSSFLQYLHTLPLPPRSKDESSLFSESARALVKELVCQRMVQDFQVVINASDELFWKNLVSPELYERTLEKQYISNKASEKKQNDIKLGQICCTLAKGREYHELTINPENFTIQVRKFVKMTTKTNDYQHYQYMYNLYCSGLGRFVSKRELFNYQVDSTNWNRLDEILVEGYNDSCTPEVLLHELQARVIRFAVVPNGNKTRQNVCQLLQAMTREDIILGRQLPVECMIDCWSSEDAQVVVKLDMGMFKGDRYEWIVLSADKFHVPHIAYHWTLYWLVCEGGVIDDYIQRFQRRAKQLGLVLCQVPLAFDTKLGHSPWTMQTVWYNINSSLWKGTLEPIIHENNEFFLDYEAPSRRRWVHCSGSCMLEWESYREQVQWYDSNFIENTTDIRKQIFETVQYWIFSAKIAENVMNLVLNRVS